LAILCSAFSLSLVLPKAPYSDQKGGDNKKMSQRVRRSCCYGGEVLKQFFSVNVIFQIFFHILPSASILAMVELCMFIFLQDNALDKLYLQSSIAIPFFVLGTYYLTIFLVSIFKCVKCYGQDRGYYE
jgi:hypothetical protein